ncbi:MAG: hypothetical protein WCE64_03755, partial [Bacteroidales bacterium]
GKTLKPISMKRKEFFKGCGACGALAFFEFLNPRNASALKPSGFSLGVKDAQRRFLSVRRGEI